VYSAPIKNIETLRQCIFHAYQTTCSHPSTFERVLKSVIRHVFVCIDSVGGYSEHLLQIVMVTKNSAVIKLGTCTVCVLCQLYRKIVRS